jgi:glyoxylase-like metal-dependent hydrolase (beta-lactamase superfamily II)
VRLAIVRTAQTATREALLFAGGRLGAEATVSFSAFLVEHGDARVLIDTGLGRRIDAQYDADMPHWMRPFFSYRHPVEPARDQLDRAGLPPVATIVLTHAHWDHASALGDFPEAQVWIAPEEQTYVHEARGGGAPWPSQVGDPAIQWRTLVWSGGPYESFPHSLDLYGDGTVMLVAMPGHTPGSVGVFVRTTGGRRLFLVGDTVWNAGALVEGRPKFALARWIVDSDADSVQVEVARIQAAQRRDPALEVVPAHDGDLQARMGVFPQWIE